MLWQLLGRQTYELRGRFHGQGRDDVVGIELLGLGQGLGAESVEVVRRSEPHALLALGHARKELRVLAVGVVGALEVMPSRKVVQQPHTLVLRGERGYAVEVALALVLPAAAVRKDMHLHTWE